MLSLRAHAIICGSLFAALLLVVPVAAGLQLSGIIKDIAAFRLPAIVLLCVLFGGFAFSTVPVIVKLVFGVQEVMGNDRVPLIHSALRRQNVIIWGMWGLMAAGLLVAVPAAIADGALGADPQRVLNVPTIGKSRGVLAGKPGMKVEEMISASSLAIATKPGAAVISSGEVFDFRIPDSEILLPRCRYYYISTFSDDPSRIQAMSIGTAPEKATKAEIHQADAALRAKLAGDGWLAGHEVYRTHEDSRLHGGTTQRSAGRVWLKDGVVLTIESKQIEDSKNVGAADVTPTWIQTISLWTAPDYPGVDRIVFDQPPV